MTSLVFVMLSLVELMNTLTADTIIHPANISAPRMWVKEGDIMTLECSVSDTKISDGPRHMYLCKDGTGILMSMLLKENDTSFKVDNVTTKDSGKYSCVYSHKKMLPREVNATGEHSVFIHVYGPHTVHPALISGEKSLIREGATLQLECQITNGELPEELFLYLCKNGVGRLVEPLMNSTHAIFRIGNITRHDSGNYSCVLAEEQTPMKVRGEGAKFYISVSSEDSKAGDEPRTPCSGNVFRILCSIAVLIVAVVVLSSGRICQQKDVCEEKEEA
ncbi:hypothetical protein ACEWY4_026915 [Coilia grayii]|uniref:Ig-like domain-containing protein n=1 Tax=Coilia grayii TaxID=363190 RepID=A0ABD1IQX6_9TELE